jgi:hypothetical protein
MVCVLSYWICGDDMQQARAQKSTGENLRTYNNGIYISYPINWKVIENISKYNIATFLAPSPNSSDIHPAAIAIYKQNLSLSYVPNELGLGDLGFDESKAQLGHEPSTFRNTTEKFLHKDNMEVGGHSTFRNTTAIDEEDLFTLYTFATIYYIYEHYNITNISPTQLSGSAAYRVDFNADGRIMSYILTMRNYNVYGIMLVTSKINSPYYLDEFDKIKDSFKIDIMKR